jgi:mono/diheme cytochrome c family protein
MKLLKFAVLAVIVAVVLAVLGVYSGLFNVAADEPHWALTHRIIETLRERSIASRSSDIKVATNLDDPKLIASGAGEYAEMCTGCHLAPGMEDTEMRTGLYPKPPNLAEDGAQRSAAQQFWIIKHGLKMSGMPAWGLTHDDERIWSMVAFVRKLPKLTPASYHELIEASGGHHHEGMEGEHSEAEGSDEKATHDHAESEGHDHAVHDHAQMSAPAELPPDALNAAETVDSFQRRLAQGDVNGAAQLLDPSVLIFESGEAETSRAEYASHHLKSDAAFLKNAEVRRLSRTGNASGSFAWVATESELKTSGAKPVDLISTETMVLQRGPEGWRVAHIHWSSRKK